MYIFPRKTPLPAKNGGLPLSAVARPAQQAHTSGVPSGLLYHPPRAPPVRDNGSILDQPSQMPLFTWLLQLCSEGEAFPWSEARVQRKSVPLV